MRIDPSSVLGYDLKTLDLNRFRYGGPTRWCPGWDKDNPKAQTRDLWAYLADRLPRHWANPFRVQCPEPTCGAPLHFTCHGLKVPMKYGFPFHLARTELAHERFWKPFSDRIMAEHRARDFRGSAKIKVDRWLEGEGIWLIQSCYECPECLAEEGERCVGHDGEEWPDSVVHHARWEFAE